MCSRERTADPKTDRIPLDAAHHILATFGITQPTKAYERWVKQDGFDLKDFDSVLFESPFVFTIDWRSSLDEGLELVVQALGHLGVSLHVELEEAGDSGTISNGSGRRAAVSYRPGDDGFDNVFLALQNVVPEHIEFRASPSNDGSDTWVYAVLPRDEWGDLDASSPYVVNHFFQSVPQAGSSPRQREPR